MSELNLALMGPPGAGKGTQAERLVDDFDLPYYATGDILRAAVKEESPLGKEAKQYMENGDLVPDELICEVIMERVDSAEADGGFLLDGFPRTVGQAEALDRALNARGRSLTASLLIVAPDDEVVRRLSGRRICQKNGHVYHLEFDPPKNDDACDQDGSKLLQRDDDREETVRKRLSVYHDQTEPLIDWYDQKGLLRRFDGTRKPDEVHQHIRATLATLKLEAELVIIRKTPEEIDAIAAAGSILVRCHDIIRSKARPGVTTGDLDAAAEKFIRSQGGEPVFKGYRGFPGSICASPNSMVVHGIPGSYRLSRGDVLSVDIGVTLDGWVADAAITHAIGNVTPVARKLLETTRASLFAAVEQCRPGAASATSRTRCSRVWRPTASA